MRKARCENGFTLVELLVALIVTSIITAAVATLAFALSSASKATSDWSEKQAQIRYATLRISELVRNCKLICGTPGSDLAVWKSDENEDGQINVNELVFIEIGGDGDYLRLCEFPSSDSSVIDLSDVETLSPGGYDVTYVGMVPECSNAQFSLDVEPPYSRFVSFSFDVLENEDVRRYQISAKLRSWAGNLLNDAGDGLVSDDD